MRNHKSMPSTAAGNRVRQLAQILSPQTCNGNEIKVLKDVNTTGNTKLDQGFLQKRSSPPPPLFDPLLQHDKAAAFFRTYGYDSLGQQHTVPSPLVKQTMIIVWRWLIFRIVQLCRTS